jgi:hypothetical protein
MFELLDKPKHRTLSSIALRVGFALASLASLVGFLGALSIRFDNPALTETQLFLDGRAILWGLLMGAGGLVASVLWSLMEDDDE